MSESTNNAPRSQAWFRIDEIQKIVRKSAEQLAQGMVIRYHNIDTLIKDLKARG